jgi:hypothetical protein
MMQNSKNETNCHELKKHSITMFDMNTFYPIESKSNIFLQKNILKGAFLIERKKPKGLFHGLQGP